MLLIEDKMGFKIKLKKYEREQKNIKNLIEFDRICQECYYLA